MCLEIHKNLMTDRDVLWYVDNTSAASALVKGSSPTADNSPLALLASLSAADNSTRLWFEHVWTHQNWSDGLSRDGYEDAYVKARIKSGQWRKVQPDIDWKKIGTSDLTATRALVQRWGDGFGSSAESAVGEAEELS